VATLSLNRLCMSSVWSSVFLLGLFLVLLPCDIPPTTFFSRTRIMFLAHELLIAMVLGWNTCGRSWCDLSALPSASIVYIFCSHIPYWYDEI
jgi:hypothetical protein